MLNKKFEQLSYIFLLISNVLCRISALFLISISFLFKKKKPKKDFLFFPYTHKDNIGAISRFQIFLPLLEKEGYTYDIFYIGNHRSEESMFYTSNYRTKEYLSLSLIFWRRLFQAIKAGNYRAVFFQRGMYPLFYDQFTPYLEILINKINRNVTVDYYDAEYLRNKKLINSIVKTTKKVSVATEYLFNYFKLLNKNIFMNDLAMDISVYEKKSDFSIHKKIILIWTGSKNNSNNLKPIIPILEKINKTFPLQLIIVSRLHIKYNSSIIRFVEWGGGKLFHELTNADIAIYPAFDETEYNLAKVAYKSLEFGAAALPIIASNLGLSPHFVNEEDVLIANTPEEWEKQIIRLINDEELRKKLGTNARIKTEKFHSVESTYKNFLTILLGENPAPLKNKGSI